MPSKKKSSNLKKTAKKVKTNIVEKKEDKDNFIKSVQRRDGTIVPFDIEKIKNAINKAMLAAGEGSVKDAEKVAERVLA